MTKLTPAAVLKFVREDGAMSLHDIGRRLDRPVWPEANSSSEQMRFGEWPPYVGAHVESLVRAGLVVAYRRGRPRHKGARVSPKDLPRVDPAEVLIEVGKDWERIQNVLSISLTELNAKQTRRAMIVSPLMGPPDSFVASALWQLPDVFVLMPFSRDMDSVYDQIRTTILKCGFTVGRADDVFGGGQIIQQIWASICAAKLIIADCTGKNPNVFYEIGLAHAVGTPTLLLSQDVDDVPFDVRALRIVQYRTTRDGIKEFQIALETSVRSQLAHISKPSASGNLSKMEDPRNDTGQSPRSQNARDGVPSRQLRKHPSTPQ